MKVLITGSEGQLGSTLNFLKPKNIQIINTNRENFDLTNGSQISKFIFKHNPDWIINSGAYTAVDEAEKEPEKVFATNSDSVKIIAETLKKTRGKILQIGTDFVFDGKNNKPYTPYEKTNPLGIYGLSKLKGEEYIKQIFNDPNKAVILRTSWLMGNIGNNFALKMLKLHKEKKHLNIVADQIGSPTNVMSLAKTCWEIILFTGNWGNYASSKIPIMHWCDSGIASWYDIAVAVGEIGIELGLIDNMAEVNPIKSIHYPTPAKRPTFSVLDNDLTQEFLNLKSIHWRKSMVNFLKLVDKNKI